MSVINVKSWFNIPT